MNATEALNCQVDFLNSIISGMGSQEYKFIRIQCKILFVDLYEFSVLNYLACFYEICVCVYYRCYSIICFWRLQDQQAEIKGLKGRIGELEQMMLGDVEVDASPAGNLVPSRCLPNPIPGVIAGFGRGDTISRSCEDDFPEETLYMNRSGGRIQMYYESSDHLWDEDTF